MIDLPEIGRDLCAMEPDGDSIDGKTTSNSPINQEMPSLCGRAPLASKTLGWSAT